MSVLDAEAIEGLTEIFRVLGDPTRVRILDSLSRAELCVMDLASQLKLTESAVSHQLRLLRSARINLRQLALRLVMAHELVDAAHVRHHGINARFALRGIFAPYLDVNPSAHDRIGALMPLRPCGQRR